MKNTNNSKMLKSFVAAFGVMVIALLVLAMMLIYTTNDTDTVKYKGEKYSVLGYPADIFMYDLAEGVECEEDETVPLEGSQWRMVYNNTDVYCHTADIDDANAYYSNHENYDWFVIIENEDSEVTVPLEITMEDFEYIYRMEDIDKETAIFFDEIEAQGSLIKVSKDGFIEGRIGLAELDGKWYWRTETIDESREHDGDWPEYVIPLPEAVSDQIEQAYGRGFRDTLFLRGNCKNIYAI